MPDEASLKRRDDAGTISYRLAADALPPGTLDTIDRLNAAGVPLSASVRDASRVLRDTGKGVRTEVLGAALRARRVQAADVSRMSGNISPDGPGNGDRKHPADVASDQEEMPSGTSGKHNLGRLVALSPPLGGKHHGAPGVGSIGIARGPVGRLEDSRCA
ncbi:MAG: hypothetical protein R2761_09690 [Acidimicrobiales bacterium]